jgi:hypothetical protein
VSDKLLDLMKQATRIIEVRASAYEALNQTTVAMGAIKTELGKMNREALSPEEREVYDVLMASP